MSSFYRGGFTACFSVQSAVDPGVLPRILAEFGKLGLTPLRLTCSQLGERAAEMHADLQFNGLSSDQVAAAANRLRRIVAVDSVLTYEKPLAEPGGSALPANTSQTGKAR